MGERVTIGHTQTEKTRIERDRDREAERKIGVDLGAMRRVSGSKVGLYMYVYLFASGTVNYDE